MDIPSVPASFVLDDEVPAIAVAFAIPAGTWSSAAWKTTGNVSSGTITNQYIFASLDTVTMGSGFSGAYAHTQPTTANQLTAIQAIAAGGGGAYGATVQDFALPGFTDSVSSCVLSLVSGAGGGVTRVYPVSLSFAVIAGDQLRRLSYDSIYHRFTGITSFPVAYQINRDWDCDFLFFNPGRMLDNTTPINANVGLRVYRLPATSEGVIANWSSVSKIPPIWTGCADQQQFIPVIDRIVQYVIEFYSAGTYTSASVEFSIIPYKEIGR